MKKSIIKNIEKRMSLLSKAFLGSIIAILTLASYCLISLIYNSKIPSHWLWLMFGFCAIFFGNELLFLNRIKSLIITLDGGTTQ